jgi:hypothetical protein
LIRLPIAAAVCIAVLPGADLISYVKSENRLALRTSDGAADLTWISASTFRFRYSWSGSLTPPPSSGELDIRVAEEPAALLVRSGELEVRILKRGLLLIVADAHGKPLLTDLSPMARTASGITLERSAPAGIRYYGLGPRAHESLDARGESIETGRPFLISSAGYGEYHAAPGTYSFDIARTRPDRYTVTIRNSSQLDFYLHFGPTPKEILEEHLKVSGAVASITPARLRSLRRTALPEGAWLPPPSPSLAAYLRAILHASFSGSLLPVFDAALFERTLPERAAQLGALAPLLLNGRRDERFIPFLLTYTEEARDRGLPVIRPLPLQYPRDGEAHRYTDEFMLGDELLVAPILSENLTRRVYLPMGIWTDWRTNRTHGGRQVITVEASPAEHPIFIKNGAILPLLEQNGMMHVHYFPRLAAEFFIYEPDAADYTQVHAAPAADDMRLETESKVSRDYRWIVHHLEKPRHVATAARIYNEVFDPLQLRDGTWHWERSRRNLLVQAHVVQDSDHIVNISF